MKAYATNMTHMTPTAKDILSINLKDNEALAELFKTKQPGDKLDFSLTDGTTVIEGKFVIDELLSDKVTGQLTDLEVEGGEAETAEGDDEEAGEEAEIEDKSNDKIGASVLAVMTKKK